MGRVSVKRLRCIAGRYFWRPTPSVKRLGFAAEALGSDLAKAVARAQQLNALVDQTVAGKDSRREAEAEPYSVAALVELYRQDEEFTNLRPKTQAGYNSVLRNIVSIAGGIPVENISRKDAKEMYRRLKTERGLSTAAAHMRVWRILGQLAVNEGWREDNPFTKLKIKSPDARRQVWEEEEVRAFCKTAIEMGLPSMAIAVQLGLHLGQRLATFSGSPGALGRAIHS